MKKLLTVVIASFLIIGFSSVAWCSSVVGSWSVDCIMSVKVKVEGEGSAKDKGYVWDWFDFYQDGYFESWDMDGLWTDLGKGKFIVNLDQENIEDYYEDELSDAVGIAIYVDVEDATFAGKWKDGKKGETIKGKFTLVMSFYNHEYNIYGTVKAKAKYVGERPEGWGLYTPADKANTSQFADALSKAIQEALNEANLGK
jgi:hypothetical protein